MAEVFISYSREDTNIVRNIADGLQRSGINVFWDSSRLSSGDFMGRLAAELRQSKCVVVCWSRRAVQSQWVLSECRVAATRSKLLPVKIEPIHDSDIPVPFAEISARDLSSWRGGLADRQWQCLWDDVKSLLLRGAGRHQPPDPAAIRSTIRAAVDKAGGSISQAHVAAALTTRWPEQAGPAGWFGYKRFGQFFRSLELDDVALDPTGPGRIVRIQHYAFEHERRGPRTASDFQLTLAQRVFIATGAPALPPAQYRAMLTTVAGAIQAGAASLAEITRRARDELQSSGTQIGRGHISFAAKGALIDGLDLMQRPMEPVVVARHFANSLADLCRSGGLELNMEERTHLLGVVGFADRIGTEQPQLARG